MKQRLVQLWDKLTTRSDPGGGWERLRIPEISVSPLYVARDMGSGLEALVLEVPTKEVPGGGTLPASRGFEVLTEPVLSGPGGTTRIILALTVPAFRDVFMALAVDVVSTLASSRTRGKVAVAMLSRVERWQRFLEIHGPSGLSETERRGLVAELMVLRKLLGADKGTARESIESWKGPSRGPQDFVLPSGSIEVKSTASQSPSSLVINNLDQLAEDRGLSLVLMLVVIGENPSVGPTLPELVREVSAMAKDASDLLWSRLHTAGYISEHEPRYEVPRYQVLTTRAFSVVEGFPRLIRSAIDPRITSAKYSISLEGLKAFEIDDFNPLSLYEN